MSRPTQITIDIAALHHNCQRIRELAPGRALMAMVKANAYGHGLERIALALSEVDALGVASFEEALHLRQAGVMHPIVLMEGLFYPDELPDVVDNDFVLVVHHLKHLEMLEQCKLEKPLSVWVKINTGMNRLGFEPKDFKSIYSRLLACESIRKPLGWMTHFAEADTVNGEATLKQIELFNNITRDCTGPKSLANSAGILAWPTAHADWVRPGIMLYGASPFENKTGLDHGLQPVMTLHSQLIAIQHVSKGARIGYGGTWTAPEDRRIGVVGVGYGDGYPQYAVNGTPILVNGQQCPLVGRVSMDMLTVDLSEQPAAKIGDPVVLWGKGLPVEMIAKYTQTSAYEILTRMTQRPRIRVKASLK